jgi:hypothetical protein
VHRSAAFSALPAAPETVAAFLAHEAERRVRPSTIARRVAAIRYAHKLAGLPLPTDDERVRATVRGIRRSLGAAPSKKAPATAERVIGVAPLAGAEIVKVHARRAGLDPKLFAGHSLRSGFLTSAAARGASIFKMADQSRHKSMDTLRGYVRDAEIFKDHAGEGLL